jgi:putative oxidoreductase
MSTSTNSKGWNIALWILQVILAAMFLMAGFTKVSTPLADLTTMMPWTADVPLAMVRFIGASEILGALGLLLPSLLRIKPVLTPVAAAGLVVVMVLAALFHATRGEFSAIGFNFVLASLAAVAAWGRFKKAPVTER